MEIILALLGVTLIPIIIVTLLPKNRSFFEKSIVKGFGLGVYLMLVVVLLYEAVEIAGVAAGFTWLLAGLFLSFLIGVLFKEFHHHHSEEEKKLSHNKAGTWRILVSDFFHNIVDGLAIVAGFAISPTVGFIAFLGVLGHQIVQQVGQQILLVESGMKPLRAIVVSLLIAMSIFLGFFLQESLESIILAFSAGIVAWKVWVDITHMKWDKKVATGFIVGALLLASILLVVPHSHGDEGGHMPHEGHEEGHEEHAHENGTIIHEHDDHEGDHTH
jgi:zinc transporter ZupT